uniref:Uncharacterized protein n=1 Tax=Alexandrium monilatum TaxID=311494 RepID=A0A7S4RMT9_9DINO
MQCLGNLGRACEKFCGPRCAAAAQAPGEQRCRAAYPASVPSRVPPPPAELGHVAAWDPPKLADMVEVGYAWADGGETLPETAKALVDAMGAVPAERAAAPEAVSGPPSTGTVLAATSMEALAGGAGDATPETHAEQPEASAAVAPPPVQAAVLPSSPTRGAVSPAVAAATATPPPQAAAVAAAAAAVAEAAAEAAAGPPAEPAPPLRTEGLPEEQPASDLVEPLLRAVAAEGGGAASPREQAAKPASQQPAPLQAEPPALEHDEGCSEEMPFFVGSWPGTRSDWTGDVGVSFVVRSNCRITALGRHAGTALCETVTVTLWLAETRQLLAAADVGPSSEVEGGYAFEALSCAVEARAGTEYRLTQRCRGRMLDKWFDGCATADEVRSQTALQCAKFVGGVCRNDYGFPSREDGEHRRAGMVNFKFARVAPEVVPVTRAELAQRTAAAVAAEASGDRCFAAAYLSVAASLLALLADELAALPGAPATVVVADEASLRGLAQIDGPSDAAVPAREPAAARPEAADDADAVAGDRAAGTVFERRFAEDVVAAAAARRGRREPPSDAPLEGVFVVSPGGAVLATAASVARSSRAVGAAELLALLGAGMVLSRSAAGAVTVLLAPELSRGCALQLQPTDPLPGGAH